MPGPGRGGARTPERGAAALSRRHALTREAVQFRGLGRHRVGAAGGAAPPLFPPHPNPSGQRRQSPARLQVGSALRGWAQLCGVGSGSGSPAPGAGKGRKNQQVEAPPLLLGSPRSVELCFCSEELSRGFSGDVG